MHPLVRSGFTAAVADVVADARVAAAAGVAWDGPARGMGRDEAGRDGLGLGGDWVREEAGRDGAGAVGAGRVGSRCNEAAQGGVGPHGVVLTGQRVRG